MGHLVNGIWRPDSYQAPKGDGSFERKASQFRNWITPDGAAGPTGRRGFKAEADRYHLYVSHACPWAHRTLIFRHLKGLDEMISLSVVAPVMADKGWELDGDEGPVVGASYVSEIYQAADAAYTGRVTVPILWDKHQSTLVSNESSEIIRMFNSAFDHLGATPVDFYPEPLRSKIDAINATIYEHINNGVYRCGFARSQAAYETAFDALFGELDRWDRHLGSNRYLVADQITEADWRLFTTLVRFDSVYVGHFKCNKQRIADYPNLSGYLRDLYQHEGIAGTVHLDHIKSHYYGSHKSLNPGGIVPLGPDLDLLAPHGRG